MKKFLFVVNLLIISQLAIGQSQYFGQNKPRYKTFGFKVLQSPHFELYHYFDDKENPNKLLVNSEHWYKIHQEVFKLSFIKPNPLIIYKNHPDFQETTAIGGQIGEGTGGVTEGFKNRVVMPMMYSHRQTDHVLGHELVHAFQYQLMQTGDSTSLANIQNLPLFMVEGLAEYMSLGRQDSHTAMWMRDAVLSNDIPSIRDLIVKQYKYFPYRWGQAFWAYIGATYGDDMIRPLFRETALYGVEVAFARNLKMDTDRFSAKWKKALIDAYTPFKANTSTTPIGKELASAKTMGEMNISPALSPDGSYLAYISSKNVISIDIYITDARTGKIVKRIESEGFGGHVDSYSFLETAGTWSPDSRRFALVVQVKGRNKLIVMDLARDSKRTYELKGVDSFTNPAWSPNGEEIVVSGLMNGRSDLYLFDLKSQSVTNLTNDEHSDIQPTWSADGRWIYFVSDRDNQTPRLEKANFQISRMDIVSKQVETFNIFTGADNLNPLVSPDGGEVYFLSDKEGFRNLYSYNITNKKAEQLTNYFTGISGITLYSPAMTIAQRTGQIVYTYFQEGKYSLYSASRFDFKGKEVDNEVNKLAGTLAPIDWQAGRNIINKNLAIENIVVRVPEKAITALKYNPKFKLDYLGSTGMGVGVGNPTMMGGGVGLAGGVQGLFSDILGNSTLAGAVALNGEIQDIGGQIFYLNQKSPLQWGVALSHIPQRFGGFDPNLYADSLEVSNGKYTKVFRTSTYIYRQLFSTGELFAQYPFSVAKRLEAGASINRIGYTATRFDEYYDSNVTPINASKREALPSPNAIGYSQAYIAYVGDNSTFGMTSPLKGYRYRLEARKFMGGVAINTYTADLRYYKFVKPFSIATRFQFNVRDGKDAENRNLFFPLYLGWPGYVHGFFGRAVDRQSGELDYNQLVGTRLLMGNFELRLPFTGPKKLAALPSNYVMSDLVLFVDAGTTWFANKFNKPNTIVIENFDGQKQTSNVNFTPVLSIGIGLRINAMGYLILEPYAAIPFYEGSARRIVTGINIVPGW
jgi:Tol biopolymer transport system component